MLEILSHQYLKNFLRDQSINWEHIYSFGRIVSKCIANDSTYLINSEIFSSYDWLPPILISLFLKEEDSTFILSKEKIQFISQFQIDSLKNLGFNFILKNDQFIFANHHVRLITIQDLLNDPKEIAEHVMLIDLGRNDLGRVCEIGTVKVKDLMVIEKYSHVMHIVSEVEGILKNNADVWDLLKASFPAGTVTGAPKIRAMQLIKHFEKDARGPYAGVYGSVDILSLIHI